MDCRPLLEDPAVVEDGKAAKKTARPVIRFEWVCETMITNSLFYLSDWLQFSPFTIERMAPSQAADTRALLRVMVWFSVAAAAAVALALRQHRRRGVRLALALVALASTPATHYNKVLLYLFGASTADAHGFLSLCYVLLAGVATVAELGINHRGGHFA